MMTSCVNINPKLKVNPNSHLKEQLQNCEIHCEISNKATKNISSVVFQWDLVDSYKKTFPNISIFWIPTLCKSQTPKTLFSLMIDEKLFFSSKK